MYLMRTKKQYERQDSKDLQEKRDRLSEKLDDADKSTDSVEKSPAKTTNKKCEFFLDELPDGSCIRPRTISQDTQDEETAVRIAEYLGSFSVQGSDQNARAEYVAEKLVEFQSASKSKRVLLVISLSGVKVCSGDGQSVYMAHALKRISYATCDPPHHQFSFMAREPKGHINLQFCHVFSTSTQEEAEELNTIMDNAFKMAYAQQRTKQPTFNELIEKQLTDQQAKFEEYREQAQQAFKQKLDEIATPTPFSEKAKQHLEMRRQSSSDDVPEKEKEKETFVGRNKIWNFTLQRSPVKAKHMVGKVRHRSPVTESSRTSSPSRCKSPSTSTSSSSPSRPQSDFLQHYRIEPSSGSPNKRNSTPVSTTNQNNSSFLFFRSSFESSSSGKTKSSPVTALKEAIDKSFITNGSADPVELLSVHGAKDYSVLDPEGYLQPRHNNNNIKNSDERHRYSQKMVNRPLPALPTGNIENQNHKNWTSMDDNVVQRRSRSKGDSVSGSPRRQQARPQSEVFLDKRFSVSGTRFDDVGCYMYGSKSDIQLRQQLRQGFNQQSPHHVAHPRPRSRCDDYSGNTGKAPKLRMQNGNTQNPSQSDVFATNYENPDDVGRNNPGLESLMGLDRSHIEDETLRHSSWYQAGIPRDIALEILQQEEIGSFIVRDSTTHPGCYALSVRVPKFENPTGISHYLIMRTQTGVKLKGLDKEWPDLIALVTHHTVMSEMLPCTLRLPHKTNNLTFKDSDKDDKEDDPDYQRLSDFSSMMENMKV